MPRDPVDPAADSNDDSNGTSQPLSRTHDNIQPRLDLISRREKLVQLAARDRQRLCWLGNSQ
jgi:hypothetical protein